MPSATISLLKGLPTSIPDQASTCRCPTVTAPTTSTARTVSTAAVWAEANPAVRMTAGKIQ